MAVSAPAGRRTAAQVRKLRWERQRDAAIAAEKAAAEAKRVQRLTFQEQRAEAIKREQIESCYKAYEREFVAKRFASCAKAAK